MSVQSQPYGTTRDGQAVTAYTIQCPGGLEVRCINYGCRLTHLLVPEGNGSVDILLGYDTLAEYEEDVAGHGAFIGRYGNRIKGAAFELDGKTLRLTQNEGANYLHGSWAHRVFDAEVIGENSVSFTYTSPDGEDGFPGEVWVGVIYTLTDSGELVMDYRARTDADTHLNLTNHSYFNLAGGGDSGDTSLWMGASHFLEIEEDLCPTGRLLPVDGGAFDFTTAKPIGRDIGKNDPQLKLGGGYDHCFVLDKLGAGKLSAAAVARHEASGRTLRVFTTQPALQFYTANMLETESGKTGPMQPRTGFCLETQHYPDSPNQPDFPSTLLTKGAKYHEVTMLQLEW